MFCLWQWFSISFELSFACVHARVFFHSFSFSLLLHHCSLSFSLFLSLSLSLANIIGEPNKKHFSKQDHSLAKQLNHIPHADGHFPDHNTFIIFLQLLLLLAKSISLALCQKRCWPAAFLKHPLHHFDTWFILPTNFPSTLSAFEATFIRPVNSTKYLSHLFFRFLLPFPCQQPVSAAPFANTLVLIV